MVRFRSFGARCAKESCKQILEDVVQDLARFLARCRTRSCKMSYQNLAQVSSSSLCTILPRPNNLARLLVANLARLARNWPNYVQDSKILGKECAPKVLADGLKSDSCIALPEWGIHTVTSGLVPHQLVKLRLPQPLPNCQGHRSFVFQKPARTSWRGGLIT